MGDSVLCGVDETQEAGAAAKVAAGLAGRLRRPLLLAHVASEPVVSTRPYATLAERKQETEEFERRGYEATVLEPVVAKLDTPLVTTVEFGRPEEKLRELARDHAAGLIVVGTGSLGALDEFVLGSTALALTRDAPCPVVVVPPAATPARGDAIVCGVDDAPDAVGVAATASALARALDVRPAVVHVAKPGADARIGEAALAAAARGAPDAETELVSAKSTETALARVAEERDAELFVVGAHDHGLAHSTLFGSVFRALLKGADLPVVVVPPEHRA